MSEKANLTPIVLQQHTINRLSSIAYKNIPVYKYISNICGVIADDEYYMHDKEYDPSIYKIISEQKTVSLRKTTPAERIALILKDDPAPTDVLFVSLGLRKLINGALCHPVLDPYIDTLDDVDYRVIEEQLSDGSDGSATIHTHNISFFSQSSLFSVYGVADVDLKELCDFMDEHFFSIINADYHCQIPEYYRTCIIAKLYRILQEWQAYTMFYRDVLLTMRPKIICYAHGGSESIQFLYEEALTVHIPCYEIMHGISSTKTSLPSSCRSSDYLLSYSKIDRIRSEEGRSIIPVGKPGMQYPIIPDKKPHGSYVLIGIISSSEQDILELAMELSRLVSAPYAVAFKFHSGDVITDELLEHIHTVSPKLNLISAKVDIHTFFSACDIVIAERSTAALEALCYDTLKVIIYNGLDMVDHELVSDLLTNEELSVAETCDDILRGIYDYTPGRTYRPKGELYWMPDAETNFRNVIYSALQCSADTPTIMKPESPK
ncbi:MAG: hypothetical protein K6E84_05225 [Lachnospiraceae bacterium]|nr:hypothetical protein [Lachnospiraceae bacterium]